MADIKINEAKQVHDVDYITGVLANGDLVNLPKADLMQLISAKFPQLERLNYGLGGINHVSGNTTEIPANKWVYATGFADGEAVTISLEAEAGVVVNFYRDDGYKIGHVFSVNSEGKAMKTTTNLGGKPMLIFSTNGTIKKLMVEKGYFASEWKQG